MGGFKMGNAPYKKDVTPVYQVPFNSTNLVAKANKNGTIIVNKDKATDHELMEEAISHEKQHIKDMQEGKLDYDADSVTYKGKKYSRDSFNEGNPNLPWEKPAYEAGRKRKKFDLRPNKNKLDGKVSMKENSSALNFKKMGNSWNEQDSDVNSVKADENFGMPMKRWGGPSVIGGTENEKKKAGNKTSETDPVIKTREHVTDINPDTGMKRLTITTSESGGGRSYEDAYEDADKTKYPTLEDFIEAAESYNKKTKKVMEQIPIRPAVLDFPPPEPPEIRLPPDTPPDTPDTPDGGGSSKKRKFKGGKRNKNKGKSLKQNLETTKETKVCRVDDKRKFCLADMFDDKKGDSRRKVKRKARRQQRRLRRRGGRY
tara:strand:- start:261 stop:1376 length:1116 start_codon:yes stop_codon:yes gene_type:complete